MKVVYKYQILNTNGGEIRLPVGAEVLHADEQNGGFYIWALVDHDATKLVTRTFGVWGTGWSIDEYPMVDYISTVKDGAFVWHFFEVLT